MVPSALDSTRRHVLIPALQVLLCLAVFLTSSAYVAFTAVGGRLLSADFYAGALAAEHAYERIYDEVLVDPALESSLTDLFGSVEVPPQDVAIVARGIMPPAYLQRQTERTLAGLEEYLREGGARLDLSIDLSVPLANATDELAAYAARRIGALDLIELESEALLDDYLEVALRDLEAGHLPTELPSVAGVPVSTRLAAYEHALAALRADEHVPRDVVDALTAPATDQAVRAALASVDGSGDALRRALQMAGRSALRPPVDDAVRALRRDLSTPEGTPCRDLPAGADLSRCTHFDALRALDADLDADPDLRRARAGVRTVDAWGAWLLVALLALAVLALAAVERSRPTLALRWVGIALVLPGFTYLAVGLVGLAVSGAAAAAWEAILAEGDVPESVARLSGDVIARLGRDLARAVSVPSALLLLAGLSSLAASLCMRRTRAGAADPGFS